MREYNAKKIAVYNLCKLSSAENCRIMLVTAAGKIFGTLADKDDDQATLSGFSRAFSESLAEIDSGYHNYDFILLKDVQIQHGANYATATDQLVVFCDDVIAATIVE